MRPNCSPAGRMSESWKSRRTRAFGSTSTTGRPRFRRSCGSWTARASRSAGWNSPGPASTTCSSPRPAAPCGNADPRSVVLRFPGGKPVKLLRDTWLVFQRQMILVVRTPIRLVIGFAQPFSYLLLFAPLLKSALGATTYAEAYRVYVPGLLVIMVLLGGAFTGFGLMAELASGVIERSRVTPISRFALLLGRSLSEVATLLVQALIITLIAIPFGLTVPLGDILLAYL